MSKPYYRRKKAPVNHPWRQGCPSRKIGYRTELEALVAATLRPDHPGQEEATRPYRCTECSGFHLTKQPR